MNRIFSVAALLLLQGVAFAQTGRAPAGDLSYTYGELRFVDYDRNGGDGLRIGGSYDLNNNWIIVGSYTTADFNNSVDTDVFEIGGGYVWSYTPDWDLVTTARFVNADFNVPGGSGSDNGIAISAGTRGLLAPKFEIRGSVNYINLDESDTYLELAGDYYFTPQFSAGLSIEFAGDSDLFSIGARYYFR